VGAGTRGKRDIVVVKVLLHRPARSGSPARRGECVRTSSTSPSLKPGVRMSSGFGLLGVLRMVCLLCEVGNLGCLSNTSQFTVSSSDAHHVHPVALGGGADGAAQVGRPRTAAKPSCSRGVLLDTPEDLGPVMSLGSLGALSVHINMPARGGSSSFPPSNRLDGGAHSALGVVQVTACACSHPPVTTAACST
jgi:hypothetical protein